MTTNRIAIAAALAWAQLELAPTAATAQQATAQAADEQPRIVVSVTIDRLTTNALERYAHLYGSNGFRRFISEGTIYTNAGHCYAGADLTAALATIVTGTTPYYNGITAQQWLDRSTLRPVNTITDSPSPILSSTITDELKAATGGKAIIYSVAEDRETAIILAGHCSDGALYIDGHDTWKTAAGAAPAWLTAYNRVAAGELRVKNEELRVAYSRITDMATQCAASACMGVDACADMLSVAYSVDDSEEAYIALDRSIAQLLSGIEKTVGSGRALFIIAGTGSCDNTPTDYTAYNIPTGTFYVNRTQDLLNMYLGAIYGQARYVEAAFGNQLFINRRLVEQRKISLTDILSLSKTFVLQLEGVRSVYTCDDILTNRCPDPMTVNAYNPTTCGDIIIEVQPGWTLLNEQTGQTSQQRLSAQPFPIMLLGGNTSQQKITTPVTADCIAPTIARCLRIRAPNACRAVPLF